MDKIKPSAPPKVSSFLYVICKNEEVDGLLWPGGLEKNNKRLEVHQAVPLENPVGFMDCQRHRSSPKWFIRNNIREIMIQYFTINLCSF